METTKSSVFSRLMSLVLIAMGVFLGIYAFFANATTRVVGFNTRDNAFYINDTFWSYTPTTGDIVTALYGSGDEPSGYTQHRTGYNSGSCLASGMNVEFTGSIPNPLQANTIYVIDSWTYDIPSTIALNDCVALISSGTVTLSGDAALSTIVSGYNNQNIIFQNIRINGNDTGSTYGLYVEWWKNITLYRTHVYNTYYGIYFTGTIYADINTANIYTQGGVGFVWFNATNLFLLDSIVHDSLVHGIGLMNVQNSIFENLDVYNNGHPGLGNGLTLAGGSSGNIFSQINTYNNYEAWFALQGGSTNNVLWGINSHDNTGNNIELNDTYKNTLDTINASSSKQERWIHILNFSSGNILSWITITGNFGNGLVFENAINNTWTNITSNSNTWFGIFCFNSTGNTIQGAILSGNQSYWLRVLDSSYNTFKNLLINSSNTLAGIHIAGTTQSFNTINNAYHYSSWTWQQFVLAYYGTWDIFTLSSGNKIIEANSPIYYSFDSYTQNNNYIIYKFPSFATLTGTLSTGTTFVPPFDELQINTNKLILSGVTSMTVSGDNRNGILYTPYSLTSQPKMAATLETGTQGNETFLGTIEAVTGAAYLILNGGKATINYIVSAGTSGQYLNILSSIDGNIRSKNTAQSGCLLDSWLVCSFIANGNFKLFAFWVPSVMYFTGVTQSGTVITSGGTYPNTAITITFTGIHLSSATLDGSPYISGTVITGAGMHVFTLTNVGGDTTGVTFTITDTLAPLFTGLTTPSAILVKSGKYYNEDIVITYADYNFSGATVSGTNNGYYSGTFSNGGTISGTGTYIFTVRDMFGNMTGMTFTIDKSNPVVTGNTPTSGLIISGTNNIVFSRSGFDDMAISWYTLSITWTMTGTINVTGTSYTFNNMVNGSYERYVTVRDRAGNTGVSQTTPFTIIVPMSGIIILTGGNLQYQGGYPYTNNSASIYMWANQPFTYTITGDLLTSITGTGATWVIRGVNNFSTGDGMKNLFVMLTNTSGEIIPKTFLVYLDTFSPIPTLNSPVSGATVWGAFTLNRSSSLDSGIGNSGYRYYISTTPTFTTVVKSGFTTSTSASIANAEIGTSGTYYRYVKSIDKLGNEGISTTQSFIYSGTIDTEPNSFSFDDITDARLDRVYSSETITITGMTPGVSVLASVNRWTLIISGHEVGTTGYVQNGRTVKIELVSSDEYDDETSSTLTIGSRSATFSVTTMEEDEDDIETELSNTEKLMILTVFNTLRDLYAGDKEDEFFGSLMLMLESKIDEIDDEDDEWSQALQYLYDLAAQYYEEGTSASGGSISNTSRIINGVYTAPNGKKYTITFDSAKWQFTSPNFITPKFFPTLDVLKYTIDLWNPAGSSYISAKPILARRWRIAIDGQRQTSPYTAPNRKVFYFFKTIDGRYSSYTFTTERYFDSLEDVKEFIYNSNR